MATAAPPSAVQTSPPSSRTSTSRPKKAGAQAAYRSSSGQTQRSSGSAANAATTVASARSRPLGAHLRTSGTVPIMHPGGWSSGREGVRWRRSGNETVAGTGSGWRQLLPSTGSETPTATDVDRLDRLDQVTVTGQVGKIGQRAD